MESSNIKPSAPISMWMEIGLPIIRMEFPRCMVDVNAVSRLDGTKNGAAVEKDY